MTIFRQVDARFNELFDGSESFTTLAQGFRFTEGATWHPLERHVTFSDIPSNRLHRWSAVTGETTIFRDPSDMTNGMTYDREGRLLMCEHLTTRVTRLESDGSVTVLADRWQGAQLNSPNDIVVDKEGGIWFTDPLYGRQSDTGVEREAELPFQGVFKIDTVRGLQLVDDDYTAPNGLCFSPDMERLYVNDSESLKIRVYAIDSQGVASDGKVFAEIRDFDGTLGYDGPDGMKVDARGNVWCAGHGGIHVFDDSGVLLGVLLTPEFPGNFCFGGDDMRTLFVCASTTFLSIPVLQPGQAIF